MANETARRDKVTFLISSHDLSLFSNPADNAPVSQAHCLPDWGKTGSGGNQEKV